MYILHTHASEFWVWIWVGLPTPPHPPWALSPSLARRLADPALRALLSLPGSATFHSRGLMHCSKREAGTSPVLQKQAVGLILCLLTIFV